jgi:hypothetical protein
MAVDHERYAFSFSHGIITCNGQQFSGISSVSFSQDVDRSAVYGTSRKPLKRSAGQVQMGEGAVTFSDLEDAMRFYSSLGDDPSLALFVVDFTVSNEAGDVRSFECLSCALSGFSAQFEAGADALGLEVPFSFMMLKVDGKEFAR